MCGITGWIDWDTDLTQQRPILEAMSATLANRGPDADGIWLSSCAGLAHRRLVVVDPTGGAQPMTRMLGDNQFIIIYNGELYNTPELRRQLEAKGYNFRGHSDTEVLLTSYLEWGPSCVEKLNGIFAFAIWNEADQNLFLARDRLGVKPLFYTQKGSSLIFASELKALLAHPTVEPVIDAEGLAEIFALGPSRTPGHGVFRGVKEVRPGHCLIYNRQICREYPYWTLTSQPHEDSLETTAAKIRELFRDAVRRQLVADVPVCTFLSGGVDSTAITAFAVEGFNDTGMGPLHTYSIDYEGNDQHFTPNEFQPNSDAHWVRKVSRHYGTAHHYINITTPQLVESLVPAVKARDLPGMADIDSSLYLFCCEIKKEATVALSGECADEIFGGYPWFHRQEDLNSATFPWIRMIDDRINLLAPDIQSYISPHDYLQQRYQETLAQVPRLAGEEPFEARIREIFYLNLNWFMATLLDRKDRMSMATGLEVRVPFCDHRLVEYAWNIPWTMKNCDGIEKGILRRALKDVLPDDVLLRRKSPYPKTHNPAYLAAVRQWLMQILEDSSSPLKELINLPRVKQITSEGCFGKPWFGQLMTDPQIFAYLIQVDTWMREYKVSLR